MHRKISSKTSRGSSGPLDFSAYNILIAELFTRPAGRPGPTVNCPCLPAPSFSSRPPGGRLGGTGLETLQLSSKPTKTSQGSFGPKPRNTPAKTTLTRVRKFLVRLHSGRGIKHRFLAKNPKGNRVCAGRGESWDLKLFLLNPEFFLPRHGTASDSPQLLVQWPEVPASQPSPFLWTAKRRCNKTLITRGKSRKHF